MPAAEQPAEPNPADSADAASDATALAAGPYVFISYSRQEPDVTYVAGLARELQAAGVPAWYDQRLVSGDPWEDELRSRVDSCAALIVVMSPNSEASQWVHLEVGRARYQARKLRPILLSGKPFQRIEDIQYEPVSSGQIIASAAFLSRLREDLATALPPRSRTAVVIGRGIPPRNPNFVGRTQLMLNLEESLYWGRSVAVEALQGTGGVGKTQLVAEFAYRHHADYDLIAWINADRVELIPDQLAALAEGLEVPSTPDVLETAKAVLAALGRTSLAWLLVFDNADQPGDLLEWLPESGTGHVIVTSRQTGWDALGSKLDVDVLSRAEAVALLRTRLSTVEDAAAGEIVEELGRLPLAVEQAAAYLAETDIPAGDYLHLLRTQGEELLDKGYAPGYEHTVATVWHVSQASLHINSRAAEQLLRLCAFLGPEPIPLDLFSRHPDLLPSPLSDLAGRPARFEATVGALVARSLARRSIDGLTVHRLLATVVRRPLPELDRHATIETVGELLYRHLPTEVQRSPENWPIWRALLPHVLAATSHPSPHLGERDRTPWLLDRAGLYLFAHGQPAAAQPLLERAVHIEESSLGAGHPTTLASRINLASIYQSAGRLDRAIALYEATLADQLRVLAPNHPDILAGRNNLAYTYQAAGHLDQAIPLFEATLADRLRVFGPDHPDTLRSRNNLAVAYRAAGQLNKAFPLLEATLADRLRVLGHDHPDTLESSNNLAAAYRAAGQLDQAIALFEVTLVGRQRALGHDHPDTLHSRNNVAHAYHMAGQLHEAVPLYEATLTDRQRVLGPDHPDTLISRNNLAVAYQDGGQLDKAIPLLEANFADQLRMLGPDHPDTLAGRNNLAAAHFQAGQLERALPLLEANLATMLRILGPDHPDTLTSRNNLALAYQEAGQLDKAFPLLEANFADRLRLLGADHPDTLTSRINLGGAFVEAGQLERAISLYAATLTDALRVLGPDHPLTKTVQGILRRVRREAEGPSPLSLR